MTIVHRPGRVHSNVDPISRLRREVPKQVGPAKNKLESVRLDQEQADDPLRDLRSELAERFDDRLSKALRSEAANPESRRTIETETVLEVRGKVLPLRTVLPRTDSTVFHVSNAELKKWRDEGRSDEWIREGMNVETARHRLALPISVTRYSRHRLALPISTVSHFYSIGSTRPSI